AHRNAAHGSSAHHPHHYGPNYKRHTGLHHGSTAAGMPEEAEQALSRAMALERVPQTWEAGLRFLMLRESGARSDVANPASSARGLFQLTRSNYYLNPRGVSS